MVTNAVSETDYYAPFIFKSDIGYHDIGLKSPY